MSPEYETALRVLVREWSLRTIAIFKERVLAKGLLKKSELVNSFDIEQNIDLQKGELVLVIKMAKQGRFQDMKTLGTRKNKKRWGYSKTLERRVAELMDDIIILKGEYLKKEVLNSFRQ